MVSATHFLPQLFVGLGDNGGYNSEMAPTSMTQRFQDMCTIWYNVFLMSIQCVPGKYLVVTCNTE